MRLSFELGKWAFCLLLLGATLSGCSYFRSKDDPEGVPPPTESGIRYGVEIGGLSKEDEALRATLLSSSDAANAVSRPPASTFVLERRAEADLPNIVNGMHSAGYYDGTVSYRVTQVREDDKADSSTTGGVLDTITDATKGPPVILSYDVKPGQRYRLRSIKTVTSDPANGFLAPSPEKLGLNADQPAEAQQVLNAQSAMVSEAKDLGYAFAKADPLQAEIDKDGKTMDVVLSVTTGPIVHMGEFTIEGADGIDSRFLRRRVLWRPGDRYSPTVMEKTRLSLVNTNLFSVVQVVQPDQLDATGRLPITYKMTQRKSRSIGAGLGYATDEGPNVSFFWENRNFLGAGEKFRSDLYLSPLRRELSANFVKPDFGARQQNLLANGSMKQEDTDAYSSESIGAGLAIERPLWAENVTGSAGIAYRLASIEPKDEEEETYGLLSLPTSIRMDYSNNLLDPTRGWRLNLYATPYTDTIQTGTNFFKGQAIGTAYVPIAGNERYVMAFRGNVGTIVGADRDQIPADERFYSGGGGSIRGYGYQLAGPLNGKDDPVGGRSVIELNSEFRYRATESIGLVYFVDSGTVADSSAPSFSEDLFVGTGVGLRYLTPIGPLRLDVGVPLDRRSVDDVVQIYVSIGQAF
ncbi:autotransporter secretion outer membrane protein TamA [Arboricoccus pini]|uniref:Autotransporter secretion outer membrane protein TamA n=1 Tax=Arboricoccus pini TaxID=1963835 RepID=A0A212PYN1_9PROT|nr:BamA/TamA family outer membrane protein [Arboricoccus pini]SNB52215.1 autotransporter secretion outer membrane protein TamA [Arboricoccus pini]